MPDVQSAEELFRALGRVPFSKNPLADLAGMGIKLSPGLQRQWDAALKGKSLAKIPQGVTPQSFRGKLSFGSVPGPPATPAAPGNYDVITGLDLSVTAEVLNALYLSGGIPHQMALDQLLPTAQLTALGGLFKVDKPGGQITLMHVTNAPTILPLIDGTLANPLTFTFGPAVIGRSIAASG